jgi:hypothetical protein
VNDNKEKPKNYFQIPMSEIGKINKPIPTCKHKLKRRRPTQPPYRQDKSNINTMD